MPTRGELEERGRGAAAPGAPARLQIRGGVEESPCALDNPAYASVRLTVGSVTFGNLGPVAASVLEDSWKPYAGTEQPVGVICRIRDAAATRLRALGYLAAVEVPVQRIAQGAIRLEVLYARVVSVRVLGDPGRGAALLQAILGGLLTGHEFNRAEAQRRVLLAKGIPGADIVLTLKPAGTGAGDMVAEVRVSRTPARVDAMVANTGGSTTGVWGGQAGLALRGLTGLGDETTVSVFGSTLLRRQKVVQFGHQMLLGHGGAALDAHLTYAQTSPWLGAGQPRLDAHTWLYSLALSYPLVLREGLALRPSLGLDMLDQDTTFAGLALSRDRARFAAARLSAEAQDLRGLGPRGAILWKASGWLELRRGLGILGGSPDCRRTGGPCAASGFVPPSVVLANPRAAIARGQADITLDPHPLLGLRIGLRGQRGFGLLPSSEQFSLGNYSIGRGYGPGTGNGDDGLALSLDAQGPVLPFWGSRRLVWQHFVFSDNGKVWQHQTGGQSAMLHSLGGGARVFFDDKARLELLAAVPLSRAAAPSAVPPPQFLLRFTTSLYPLGRGR